MTVTAARALRDRMTCFVGIGLPSEAANLARATHAPRLVLIYESGTIGAKPGWLPLSIGDGILAETADAVVSVPEIFNYWLQPGRIDVGFLGAAQIDRFGNINTTVIGADYAEPKVRLPGAGGAPEIAASCREVIVIVRQTLRTFVERVDFVTSVGFGDGAGQQAAPRPDRRRPGEGHHRPGRPGARPGDLRAGADRDLPRGDGPGCQGAGPAGTCGWPPTLPSSRPPARPNWPRCAACARPCPPPRERLDDARPPGGRASRRSRGGEEHSRAASCAEHPSNRS